MHISQSHLLVNEADRNMIGSAVAEFYARARGDYVPPAETPGADPAHSSQSKPRRAPKAKADPALGACKFKRDQHAPKVRELAEKSYGPCAIAKEIGIAHVTVRKICKEHNIPLRDPVMLTRQVDSMAEGRRRRSIAAKANRANAAPRVRALAEEGLTRRGIAERIGASLDWVARVAEEHSITIPKAAK